MLKKFNAQAGLTPSSITPVDVGFMGRLRMAARTIAFGPQIPVKVPYSETVYGPVNTQLTTIHQVDWFGAGQPYTPIAPPDMAGRQFDYPSYTNTNYNKKPLEGVPFEDLEALSDNYDLLRTLLETAKDEICRLRWLIAPRSGDQPDKRCDAIMGFLESPDKEHDWQTWLRMVLEDMLVIDAATLFPRMTKGGDLYALESIAGSTISRIIDTGGRTPLAPDPAFQQIIKGTPMCNYTRDQLIYRPRNVRNKKFYGFGYVEQIVMTVRTAICRQLYQMQYYTEGSTPDLIFSVPSQWSNDQIKIFDDYFNAKYRGNTAARRGASFVPDGVQVVDTKDRALTDSFEQWLARICCYTLGMSVQPFVSEMNRATAETANEQAKEQGIGPRMEWVTGLMNYIIRHPLYFNAPDLEFKFEDADETDPAVKSQINATKVKCGAMTIDEWRGQDGEEPLPNGLGSVPLIYTAGGAVRLEDTLLPPAPPPDMTPTDQPTDQPPVVKMAKKKSEPTPKQIAKLKKPVAKTLKDVAAEIVAQYAKEVSKAEKTPASFIAGLSLAAFSALTDPLTEQLFSAAEGGFTDVIVQVGADAEPVFGLINTRAQQIASSRAAELIGKDGDGGELADSTRLMIRGTIEDAFADGWSSDQLADALESLYAFSEERAEIIAETEMRMAIGAGAIEGARATGVVVGKQWLLSNDEHICDECQANADQGVIDIDEDFSSGDDTIPAHPGCRCVVVFLTESDEGDE